MTLKAANLFCWLTNSQVVSFVKGKKKNSINTER